MGRRQGARPSITFGYQPKASGEDTGAWPAPGFKGCRPCRRPRDRRSSHHEQTRPPSGSSLCSHASAPASTTCENLTPRLGRLSQSVSVSVLLSLFLCLCRLCLCLCLLALLGPIFSKMKLCGAHLRRGWGKLAPCSLCWAHPEPI